MYDFLPIVDTSSFPDAQQSDEERSRNMERYTLAQQRLTGSSQYSLNPDWSLKNSRGYYREVTANDRSEDYDTDFSLLEDSMTDLPPEERPVPKAIEYAKILLSILKRTIGLENIQAWPTDNNTIEFGQRLDADNQFILETGLKGITGFIKINGNSTLITGKGHTKNRLEEVLDDFAQKVR